MNKKIRKVGKNMSNFNRKRVTWSVILGIIMGIVCWALGKYAMNLPFGFDNFIFIVLNRAVLGFVVGSSAINLKWYCRGPLIGLIVGFILTYSDYMAGYGGTVVVSVTFMSLLYGFLIDFFTTKLLENNNA